MECPFQKDPALGWLKPEFKIRTEVAIPPLMNISADPFVRACSCARPAVWFCAG